MLVLDSAHAAVYSICMRAHISVTIETSVLFDFDEWRKRNGGLSRGDAVGALLRLAAGGGEVAPPEWAKGGSVLPPKAIAGEWVDGVSRDRVVEPAEPWEV